MAKTALVAPALPGRHRSGLGHLSGPVDHPVGISPCLCAFNNLGHCVVDAAVNLTAPVLPHDCRGNSLDPGLAQLPSDAQGLIEKHDPEDVHQKL